MKPQLIFFSIFMIVGFFLIIYGIYNIFYYRNLKKSKGKIIGTDRGPFPEIVGGKVVLYPIIEFLTDNKNKIKFISKSGISAKNIYGIDYSKEIGKEIEIVYPENNPKNAVIKRDLIWIKFSPLIFGIISFAAGFYGFFIYF